MATPMSEMANILHELVADDNYHSMLKRFTMEGKGRRPDATPPPLTNRLFVQLWDIMLRNDHPKKKVNDWFGYLYGNNPVCLQASPGRLRSIVSSTYAKALGLVEGPQDRVLNYLDLSFDFNHISDTLSAANITRDILLGEFSEYSKPQNFKLTNSIVLELDKFHRAEGYYANTMAKWIFYLTHDSQPKEQDKKVIKNLIERVGKLRTKRNELQGRKKPEDYEKLLNDEFFLKETNPKVTPSGIPNSSNILTHSVEKKSSKPEVKEQSTMCNIESSTESELLNVEFLKMRVAELEKELEDFKRVKEENMSLKREVKNLKRKISRSSVKLATTNCHLQNSERKRKLELDQKNGVIDDLEASLEAKQRKVKALKEEKKSVTAFNDSLSEKIFKQQTLHEVEIKSGQNNAYTDNIRQATILLQSEAGVASQNVSKVMRIVGKYIFDYDFETLPSTQTCLNMNAEGLVLSNLQVAEKILDSKSVTLHLDGTSRDHQKVVNHQVTLDDGSSFYLGFTLVAAEDANTILEVTISLLKKISEFHSDVSQEQAEEIFKTLLRKIKNTMTDRAATMKCFDKKLQDFLSSEVGENIELNFLHCNAHFLLGLSDVTDKALKEVENEIKQTTKEEIGRDKDAQFSRFLGTNETSSNRLIRTLCEILGPRGDQKNGCRVEWKEFCPDSKIPSFKANRFNCFFEAAAAIIHHYDKIKSFFISGVLSGKSNQKIQSVGLDIQDPNLINCICALALIYLKVSGPYWNLVNSSTSYSAFCQHVRTMHRKFLEWSSGDSLQSDFLSQCSDDLFGSSFSLSNSAFSRSVHSFLNSRNCDISLVSSCLKTISEACSKVTSRQLGNFLDGSFDPHDEILSEVLKNCPLTNLIGESSFGDLDYDIRKRANCSNLQRTASHCVKRNKTCSEYLDSKSKRDKALMFSVARQHRKSLVEEAKSCKNEISIKIKQSMVESQQKKIDKAAADFEKHGALSRRIDSNGGLCESSEQVDRLLKNLSESGKSKTQITEIIKDQIRYHKNVKNVKDKILTLSGTQQHLISKLKQFLN